MTSVAHKAFWIAFAVMVAAFLPYIAGWVVQGDQQFFANYVGSPSDSYAYYALIEQSRQGAWLFLNTFTFEAQAALWIHPLWLVLGKLAWASGLSSIAIYHIARAVAGIALLMGVFHLTSWVTPHPTKRLLLLVYTATAGGLSWVLMPSLWAAQTSSESLFFLAPSDAWITESVTFHTLMHTPLFALSQLLLVLIFGTYWKALQSPTRKNIILLALMTALLAWIHPYDMFLVFGVMLVHGLGFWVFANRAQWKSRMIQWARLQLWCGVPVAMIAAYLLWVLAHDASMRLWAQQNITLSPPVSAYLTGFGFIWVGLIAFVVYVWKRGLPRPEFTILVAWLITAALLVYAPIEINRRFTNGVHIPFALVSGYGFMVLCSSAKKCFGARWDAVRASAIMVVMTLLAGSSIYAVVYGVSTSLERPVIMNAPKGLREAAEWANASTPMDARFWIHPTRAVQWTALTGRIIHIGHGHQTYRFADKLLEAQRDWWYGDAYEQEQFLAKWKPDYIVLTDLDTLANPQFFFDAMSYPLVYRNDDVTIYRYIPNSSSP